MFGRKQGLQKAKGSNPNWGKQIISPGKRRTERKS